MYKDMHEVPYNSKIKEAIIGPFGWGQLMWLAPGLYGSFIFAKFIPKIPIDSVVFSRIHWFVPIAIALIFMSFRDRKTNLSLFQKIVSEVSLRRRQRKFLYRRKNMPSVKEVESRWKS